MTTVTAELQLASGPTVDSSGSERWFDTVRVTGSDGAEKARVQVEASEEPEPYDAGVRAAGFPTPLWV